MTLFLVAFVLMAFGSVTVEARETGSIRIELSDTNEGKKEGIVFGYTKVATWEDGKWKGVGPAENIDFQKLRTAEQLEQATQYLCEKVKERDGTCTTDAAGVATIRDLEKGMYFIDGIVCKQYGSVKPILAEIPMWNEKENVMEYNIRIVPKYEKKEEGPPIAPQTNLNDNYGRMMLAACLSFGCGVIALFCSLRRKEHENDF